MEATTLGIKPSQAEGPTLENTRVYIHVGWLYDSSLILRVPVLVMSHG